MWRHFLRSAHALVLACVLLTGAIALSYISSQAREAEHSFFYNALQPIESSETVAIGEQTYTVTKGAVKSSGPITPRSELHALKLAYEKIVARRNPLLALPGVDLPRMRNAIALLATTSLALADIQKTEAEKRLVSRTLFPIEFLNAATETEEARRRFLITGDVEDAVTYRQSLLNTLTTYRANLDTFLRGFSAAVPHTSAHYAVMGRAISRDAILETLNSLRIRALDMQREYAGHVACIAGSLYHCDQSLLQHKSEAIRTASIPMYEQRGSAVGLYKTIRLEVDAESVVTITSPHCIVRDQAFILYTPQHVEAVGISYERMLAVDDIALISTVQHDSIPFFSFFTKVGVDFIPVIPSHYTCIGFSQDHATSHAIRFVRDAASLEQFSSYANGIAATNLQLLENSLQHTPSSEEDAKAYLVLAQKLQHLPPSLQEHIDTLSEILVGGTAGFEEFLFDLASIEYRNVMLIKKGIDVELSAPYLFFVRSGFLDTFLAYTPSVLGASAAAAFPLVADEGPYTWLSQLTTTQREKAIIDIGTYYSLHTDFLDE